MGTAGNEMKQHSFQEETEFHGLLRRVSQIVASGVESANHLHEQVVVALDAFETRFKASLRESGKHEEPFPLELDFNELAEKVKDTFRNECDKIFDQNKLRKSFQDRFIILAYGKVKSGKSSIGNHIASNADRKAEFFVFDQAGNQNRIAALEEMKETAEFEAKATEATNAIQGFRLGPLVWIDSPGLHSMTEENGKLAEKYVAAADLILFVTNSDSPARSSEMKEIERLAAKMRKKMMVVISRSDVREEDEVDGEIVDVLRPKTPEDRKRQEAYVADEIRKIGVAEEIVGGVFSVSKRLADQAKAEGNQRLWKESNMAEIYAVIGRILQNEDHLEMKREAPRAQFRDSVETIMNGRGNAFSLRKMGENLDSLRARLKEGLIQFRQGFAEMRKDLILDVAGIAESVFRSKGSEEEKTIRLTQKIKDKMGESLEQYVMPVLKAANKNICTTLALSIDKRKFTVRKITENHDITKTFSGTGSGIGSSAGAIGGLLLGALVAGPVGGMVGALVGGLGGSFLGKTIGEGCGTTETIVLEIGDDSAEKLRELKETSRRETEKMLEKVESDTEKRFFSNLFEKIEGIRSDIGQFAKEIETIVETNGKDPK
jgi:hypothetical protein